MSRYRQRVEYVNRKNYCIIPSRVLEMRLPCFIYGTTSLLSVSFDKRI